MTDHTDDGLRTDPCGCRLQYVTAGMDSGEGWEVYEPCATHGPLCGAPAKFGPCALPAGHNRGRLDVPDNHTAEWAIETDADWRGTPLAEGALAIWVVSNSRATEGRVISWTRDYVTVQPHRRSCQVAGGVPRSEEFDTRPQSVDRSKVTILDEAPR